MICDAEYIAAVSHRVHERYSPNLHAWLVKNSQSAEPLVTGLGPSPVDGSHTWLLIGHFDTGGWFSGSSVRRILGSGLKTQRWAHLPGHVIEGGSEFWAEYFRIGRCALDPAHKTSFLNADKRWATDGDHRTCTWCGAEQRLRKWEETVAREKWELVDA
jgi:hypothetical protein